VVAVRLLCCSALLAFFALEILLKFLRGDELVSKSANSVNDRLDHFCRIISDFDLLKPKLVDVAQPHTTGLPANDA